MIGTQASCGFKSQEPEGGLLPEAGGMSTCIQVNCGVEAGVRTCRDTGQVTSVLSSEGEKTSHMAEPSVLCEAEDHENLVLVRGDSPSPGVPLQNQEATRGVRWLGRPHLPPAVPQDPMGPCGILRLQRPRPVGPPCLLARGLTQTEGPLSGTSSRRDCSGPASLTLPPGLPPSPGEATLHVLC